jgi:hypothetical protein
VAKSGNESMVELTTEKHLEKVRDQFASERGDCIIGYRSGILSVFHSIAFDRIPVPKQSNFDRNPTLGEKAQNDCKLKVGEKEGNVEIDEVLAANPITIPSELLLSSPTTHQFLSVCDIGTNPMISTTPVNPTLSVADLPASVEIHQSIQTAPGDWFIIRFFQPDGFGRYQRGLCC